MIRLKHLLLEQPSTNKPKVLFVGDKQTLTRGSYASSLINSGQVSGMISGQPKATASDIYKSVRKTLNDTYNLVVIQMGPDQIADNNARTVTNSIRVLDGVIRLAKSKGVKVIVISAPNTNSKTKLQPQDIISITSKIDSNTLADDVISVNASSSDINKKTGILNSNIQKELQDAVADSINELLQTNVVSPDTETPNEEPPSGQAGEELVDLGPAPKNAADFINMWSNTAVDEMNRTGIPASITLAQAGLESAWGKSRLARKGNNYFGIKCAEWAGDKIYADDDHPNECFRKYKSAAESFKDHSNFLTKHGRYSKLFDLDKTDYAGWAKGLQSAGYATSQTYASKLISIIKSYGLDKYDSGDTKTPDDEKITLKKILGKGSSLSITSGFKPPNRPNHKGIDYVATVGTEIQLVKPGKVVRAGNIDPNGWGNTVEIKHEDGSMTRYAHLSKINVSPNDDIAAGTIIGLTGGKRGASGAGNSRGPHLHWEWLPNGKTQSDGEHVATDYFALL